MPNRIKSLKKRILLPNFLRSLSELPEAADIAVNLVVEDSQSLHPPIQPASNESASSSSFSSSSPSPDRLPTENHVSPASQTVASVDVPPVRTDSIGRHASDNNSDALRTTGPLPIAASSQLQDKKEDCPGPASTMSVQVNLHKRIWVKRQGASATLIHISEDDLVDDVREKILRKYANSLGKTFDSPDVTLRIIPRPDSHGHTERTLGPEETVAATLAQYFPAGQTIDEALIIDIPIRRTPRQSPRVNMEHYHRPGEEGGDYFSVMPMTVTRPPHINANSNMPVTQQPSMHTISVLNTGQIPNIPLPSPGAASRRHGPHRPKFGRTSTASPTVASTTGSHSDRVPPTPGVPALPTPPITTLTLPKATTPPSRADSPRSTKAFKPKKPKKQATGLLGTTSLLDGGVPPISVLIVEDNIINLRLLEAFMKRLKVRWQTAMNGRDAVVKWRTGGFHLVLMDIQLPIMSGLEATREIRRLERVNNIGVLSAKAADSTDPSSTKSEKTLDSDKLQNMDQFKSPVIVVALTASSLQSDRHEALAAGCNDFLTKPVNFVWLERKVMEWGCMQALIDFDGWRKWKDFTQPARAAAKSTKPAANAISTVAGTSGTSKLSRLAKDSNSSSSDANDTPPISKPPIPNTLVALNDKVESGDTIGSTDSLNSDDSVETLDLKASRQSPLVPSLRTFSSVGSTGSTATVTSSRSPISRQSSSQSTHTVTGRDSHPNSPVRAAAHSTSMGSLLSTSHEEGRRRKRSSLGRPGLSGVTEEVEGVGAM